MQSANWDLKEAARKNKVFLWQIADKLGIYDTALSRKLRYELPEDEKQRILDIITELAKEC